MGGLVMDDWSGAGATKELHQSIIEFNRKASRQTAWMVGLTGAILILTLVMVVGLGVQIRLARSAENSVSIDETSRDVSEAEASTNIHRSNHPAFGFK